MATTNHVIVPNFAKTSGGGDEEIANQFWKLTRAMKKAGWKYLASGDGSSVDKSGNPAADLWGGGVSDGADGAAASIAAPVRGRSSVSGLTGIVAADKGKFVRISGAATGANNNDFQIEEIVSGTEVRVDARTLPVVADANNGSLSWELISPLDDVIPAAVLSNRSWWCARGPSILKIPITSDPTPGPSGFQYLRGENVVQSGTGAEGEILGFVFDSGAGYLVIAPRLRGTGSGVYGWDTGNSVVGDLSGASVSQDGTTLEYRWELVIWKEANETTGSMWVANTEPVGESAHLLETLAASAGCDSTTPPGGGGTGNGFPGYAWLMFGATTLPNRKWNSSNGSRVMANSQIMCADCLEEQDYTADGSWTIALGTTAFFGGWHFGHTFMRMENIEDGDLSPYVTGSCTQNTLYTTGRDTQTQQISSGSFAGFWDIEGQATELGGLQMWRGWRRRGLATNDGFQNFEHAFEEAAQTGGAVIQNASADADSVATAPVITRVREPVRMVSVENGAKMRKGTCKWMFVVQGGNGTDTYDNRQFIQLSPRNGAYVCGPWDGVSTPTVN